MSESRNRDKTLGKRLGALIAAQRKAAGFTQDELAEIIGIEQESMSRIETGKTTPSIPRLFAFADALNCTIESLLVPASNRAQDQNVKMSELLKSLDEEERAFVLRLINDFAKLTHSRKRKG